MSPPPAMDQLLWVDTVNHRQQRLVVMKDTRWMEVKFYTVDQMDSGVKTNQLVKVSYTFVLWKVTVYTMIGHTWSGCQSGHVFFLLQDCKKWMDLESKVKLVQGKRPGCPCEEFLFRRKIDEVLPTLWQKETDLLRIKQRSHRPALEPKCLGSFEDWRCENSYPSHKTSGRRTSPRQHVCLQNFFLPSLRSCPSLSFRLISIWQRTIS